MRLQVKLIQLATILLVTILSATHAAGGDGRAFSSVWRGSARIVNGSGFVCHETDTDYYLMTCAHVVYNEKRGSYYNRFPTHFNYAGYTSQTFYPELVFSHHDINYRIASRRLDDVAILKLAKANFLGHYPPPKVLRLDGKGVAEKGDEYFLAGRYILRGGTNFTVTYKGLIWDVDAERGHFTCNFKGWGGLSGAPVVNAEGELIGMHTSWEPDGKFGFCIDTARIRKIIEDEDTERFD